MDIFEHILIQSQELYETPEYQPFLQPECPISSFIKSCYNFLHHVSSILLVLIGSSCHFICRYTELVECANSFIDAICHFKCKVLHDQSIYDDEDNGHVNLDVE